MKKTYKLKNIHCADCARSLEEAINGIKGVTTASINFVTEKFVLEIEDETAGDTMGKIKKLLHDFSSRVELVEVAENASETYSLNLKLVGLSCPNCSAKIKSSLEKLSEVVSAEINFTTGTLKLTLNKEPSEQIKNRIKSLIHTIEPKLKIKSENKNRNKFNPQYLMFVIGLIFAVPIFLSEYSVINLATWGYYTLLFSSVLLLGINTYLTAIKMILRLNINENLLVTISVFGAIIIGECAEGVMVIALYTLGKILEGKAVNKSRESIQDLLNLSPEFALVRRDGEEKKVSPKDVLVGETIVVRAGEKVALDGVVVSGISNINAQSLTGESRPITKKVGDEILAGVVVLDGVLEIKTTKEERESTTTKIMNLIENASENKSKTETFISRFSKYYTLIVVALAVTVGIVVGFVTGDASDGVYRGLVFLVISCPCAFAISVPLSYFGGIGNASKKGILVKGTCYLDSASKTKLVAFDKTGTLTTGEFKLSRVEVIEDAYSEEEIVFLASVGEQYSLHPLAKAVIKAVDVHKLPKPESYKEIAGLGITYEHDGTEYFVGRDDDAEIDFDTVTVVKKGNITIGKIHFEDSTKTESAMAIEGLKNMGIKTVMLSGDNTEVATKTSKTLGIDETYAELLPEDKFSWIKNETQKRDGAVLYVGDGINDAPSLAVADVGVSMGINGTDASIEASDVVLVDDDPSKLVELVKVSKFTKKIVIQNIVFASVIKLSCLILGTVGIAKMFMAVFADVGVTILAVLNSLRALKKK